MRTSTAAPLSSSSSADGRAYDRSVLCATHGLGDDLSERCPYARPCWSPRRLCRAHQASGCHVGRASTRDRARRASTCRVGLAGARGRVIEPVPTWVVSLDFVVEYTQPAPAMSTAPVPAVVYVSPVPCGRHVGRASPMVEYTVSVLPAPVTEYTQPAPALSISPVPVVECLEQAAWRVGCATACGPKLRASACHVGVVNFRWSSTSRQHLPDTRN